MTEGRENNHSVPYENSFLYSYITMMMVDGMRPFGQWKIMPV